MTVSTERRLPPIGAVLAAGALGLAVFYNGPQLMLLAGAQALLVFWVAHSLARQENGLHIPVTPVAIAVTCFWGWLAFSLSWSPVPGTSTMTFWWVGSIALSFWAYTLSPERVWSWLCPFALAGCVALSAWALVQLFVQGQPPRASFVNIHSFAALLMLVVFPAAANRMSDFRPGPAVTRHVLAASLFLLVFTVATTQGRGTTLSLFLALAALIALTYRQVPRSRQIALAALVLGAYLAANLLMHGAVGARISTLADPAAAASPRLLIWKGSIAMALDHPWLGTGLGTYYLLWPRYRDPADDTLGFFAHNDYLHIWIEAGLPAPLLLIALYVAVLVLLARFRKRSPEPARWVEAAGLVCGLLAIAMHSWLDFNLYVLPISILAGLMLARLHELVIGNADVRTWRTRAGAVLRPVAYRLVVGLVALFPLAYFVALGASDYFFGRGFALAARGDLVAADRSFAWAERLHPADDKALLAHADLYRHLVARLPADAAERPVLFREALALLDEAQAANPYRAMSHAVRARLYQENALLAGSDAHTLAAQEYARALALDPRFFNTRTAYARMLLDAGDRAGARRLLEQGIGYWYFPEPALVPFYEMTARLRLESGDVQGAAELERRLRLLQTELSRLAALRPIVPVPLPMAATAP